MSRPDDLDRSLDPSSERPDDDELRALEEEVSRVWETMSEKEQEYWIGRLIRMLEEKGMRLH